MYKKKIIYSGISFVLMVLSYLFIFIRNKEDDPLAILFTIFFFTTFLLIIYWIYQLCRMSLFALLFGNFKYQSLLNKILFIFINVIFCYISIFVYLIEYPKYVTLEEKLNEKSSFKDIKIYDKKLDVNLDYDKYEFDKDKLFTIFYIAYDLGVKPKRYYIYKCDRRYQVLKAYASVFSAKEKNNKMVLDYLCVSYQATNYYKKEIKKINKEYDMLVLDFETKYKKNSDKTEDKEISEDYKAMLVIQEFLLNSKMNNIKYNDIVKVMQLSPEFRNLEEIKIWHNYFKNETDKESSKVAALLNKLNDDFKKNIISRYN